MYIPVLSGVWKWLWRKEPLGLGYSSQTRMAVQLEGGELAAAHQFIGQLEAAGVPYARSARFDMVGESLFCVVPDPDDPLHKYVEYEMWRQ